MQYDDRVYYIASIIRLVADEQVESICTVARNLKQHDIEMDNNMLYEAYCKCGENK